MDYETIKNWFSEHKDKAVLGLCFALVFIVGFGTGRYVKQKDLAQNKVQNNYTTKTDKKPIETATAKEKVAGVAITAIATTTAMNAAANASCVIKGNISSKNKKIYHMPNGRYYKIVKPEQCFNTEEEAQAAGFIKSSQ